MLAYATTNAFPNDHGRFQPSLLPNDQRVMVPMIKNLTVLFERVGCSPYRMSCFNHPLQMVGMVNVLMEGCDLQGCGKAASYGFHEKVTRA